MIPNFRLGILKTTLYSEGELATLNPLGNKALCLSRKSDDYFKNGAQLRVIECKDASLLDDIREVFIITLSK